MREEHPGFRIFILGAGFSRPAGLPLANELFKEVRAQIERCYGRETKFHKDLDDYLDYRNSCDELALQADRVDLEEFMSYLDIEHFLGLRGSKTWSKTEGNESQLMMRKAIGQVIHTRTPKSDKLPDAYYRFAERLSTKDIVITFNYDVLLERALEHVGKPYRLFPDRFKEIGRTSNVVDSELEEVTVLKLHGSVDWFDDRQFLEIKSLLEEQGTTRPPHHSIFANPSRYGVTPLVEGPRSKDDPLLHLHRIKNVDAYYESDTDLHAPFILSPSHVKFVYADPLLSFWSGLGRAGGYNLGISIIGFSLPLHDEYIRIALFQMISNYQQSWWNEKLLDHLKDNVRLVDFRSDSTVVEEYKRRYGFVDPARSDYMFSGFGNDAIEFLFDHPRES